MAYNDNVVFKTSTTATIDDLFTWNKSTGQITAKTDNIPIVPGTVYFTSDGHIVHDLAQNNRLWMSKNAYSAIYAEDVAETNTDIANAIKYSIHYVEGPTADTTPGTWTGTINGITELYDGLTIIYVPAVAGKSPTTTLNINGLGAKTCYYSNTSAMTTHYSVGTPILLTYRNNCWRRADYNSNTTYSAMSVAEMRTGTATSERSIRADYLKTFLSTLGGTNLTLTHSNSAPYLQLNHDPSGITAGTYGNNSQQNPSYGGTFNIPYFTVDTQGHITNASVTTVKIPESDNTDYKVRQTSINSNDNNNYRILLSNSANDTSEDSVSKKNANLIYNPTENKLSTGNIKLTGELDVTGNVYLRNQTAVDSLTAGSLIVNGNSTFNNDINLAQGAVKWTSNSLPSVTSANYFLVIDAFANGGATKYITKADAIKSLISSSSIGTSLRPVYWTGSSFSQVNWFPSYCTVDGHNKNNYNYHRIATLSIGGSTWTDRDAVLVIRSRYNTSNYGIVKISGRANNNQGLLDLLAYWLIRSGFEEDSILICRKRETTDTSLGDTQVDVYLKTPIAYPRIYVYMLVGPSHLNGFQLINSEEKDNSVLSYNTSDAENPNVIDINNSDLKGSYEVYIRDKDENGNLLNSFSGYNPNNSNSQTTPTAQSQVYTHIKTALDAGSVSRAKKSSLISTNQNAIVYYTDTTGTFGQKASANGALYATSANGSLQWGTLPMAQGGTGATTAAGARTNLGLGTMATEAANNYIAKSIGTAKGDIIYWSAANTPARLNIGSVGQVLKVSSNGIPVWSNESIIGVKGNAEDNYRTGNVNITPANILGSSSTAKFWCGDNTWSNLIRDAHSKSLSTFVAIAGSDNAWNKAGNYNFAISNSNNMMVFNIGGTSNDRNAYIQVGHNSPDSYGNITGNLYLNKLGGQVYINENYAARVTSAISGQVMVADGEAGGIKTTGYTINKSVPANAEFTDRYVNSATFADDSTNTAASPVKMTLTRAGSDTATVTANIPKVSNSSAGVVPKGATVSSQTQTTKFLREDGTWAAPSYTVNTNTDTLVKQTAKSDNKNYKILFTTSDSPTSGNANEAAYDTGITINPSTHTLTATKFIGSLQGNAATASRATADANGNIITSTYKTKQTAVSDPAANGTSISFISSITQDANGNITATKATIPTVSKTTNGLVPQLPNETTTTKFLRQDGSWVVVAAAKSTTLTRDTETTIATIGGNAIKIKLPPSDNTDEKVKQATSTVNAYRKVLVSGGATYLINDNASERTDSVYQTSGVMVQPSSGKLVANSFETNTIPSNVGLQFRRGQITIQEGTEETLPAGQPFYGNSNRYDLWSYPPISSAGPSTIVNSESGSVNIMNLRLAFNSTCFKDIFMSPNNHRIYTRSVNNTADSWKLILRSDIEGAGSTTQPVYISNEGVAKPVNALPVNQNLLTNTQYYFNNNTSTKPIKKISTQDIPMSDCYSKYDIASGTGFTDLNLGTFAPAPDTWYTLSFYAKANYNNITIRTHFYPNTTASSYNCQGFSTTAANDGLSNFTVSTEWKRYWVCYKTSASVSGTKNLIARLISGTSPGTTLRVALPKLEVGQIMTSWVPHANDFSQNKISTCYIDNHELNNYQWHRIATCSVGTTNYDDRDIILFVHKGYLANAFGILKISVRVDTNAVSPPIKLQAKWLLRHGFSESDCLIGLTRNLIDASSAATADIYFKTSTTYARIAFTALNNFNKRFTLFNSDEIAKTENGVKITDLANSTEVYIKENIMNGTTVESIKFKSDASSDTGITYVSWEYASDSLSEKSLIPIANNTYDLGSSSLKWNNVYANNFIGNAATATKIAVNSTSEPSYNFYVNGTSYFNGNVTHNGFIYFANGTNYYIDNNATANLKRGIFAGTSTGETPVGNYYQTGAIEIRESNRVGTSQTGTAYAPRIGFHWGNRSAASLYYDYDGKFYLRKTNGVDKAILNANLEGNADTATKATQDANGNNIINTYLTKTAGVTNITWDNTNKKLIKTINNSNSDIVTLYAANLKLNNTAVYNTELEIKNIKIGNGSTSTSTKNVKLEYNETLEVLNFVFS